MKQGPIALWNLAGTGLWAGTLTLVGHQFASSFGTAADLVTGVMLAAAAVVTATLVVRRYRRGRGPGLGRHVPIGHGG